MEVNHHSKMGEWLKSLHEEPLEDRIRALEHKKGHRRSLLPKLIARSLNMERHAPNAPPREPNSTDAESNERVDAAVAVVDASASLAPDAVDGRINTSVDVTATERYDLRDEGSSPEELPAVPHISTASAAMIRKSSSAAADPLSVATLEDAGQRRATILAAARAAVANALLAQASPAYAKTRVHHSDLGRSSAPLREAAAAPSMHSSARLKPLRANGVLSGDAARDEMDVFL